MGDIIAGIDVVPPLAEEAFPPLQANYGLVLADGESIGWVCHEALTEPGAIRAPRYQRSADGTWLAVLDDLAQGRGGRTLFRSPDGGCSWNDVRGLPQGVQVASAAFDDRDGNRALAASDTPDAANRIYASPDGGASWEAVTMPADRRFHSVRYVDGRGLATATDPAGERLYWWAEEPDGTWTETELQLPAPVEDAAFTLLGAAGEVRWTLVDPLGDDQVFRSDDGGVTWSQVVSGLGNVEDGALVDGGILLALNGGAELVRVADDGTVTVPREDAPTGAGVLIDEDQLWIAALSFAIGPALSRATGDGPFETLFFPDDIDGPLSCPAGTDVADVCGPLWSVLEPALQGFDEDPPEDTGPPELIDDPFAPEGCGCASGSGWPGSLALAWGALAVVRRRTRYPR